MGQLRNRGKLTPTAHRADVRRQMNHGAGWIIFEESLNQGSRRLLSVLSPRRTPRDVASFIEQLYVDSHCSIRERLQYKKTRKSAAYTPQLDDYGGVMHCGHDPFLVGIYAHKILLRESTLQFVYRIVVGRSESSLQASYEERQQSLAVDAPFRADVRAAPWSHSDGQYKMCT